MTEEITVEPHPDDVLNLAIEQRKAAEAERDKLQRACITLGWVVEGMARSLRAAWIDIRQGDLNGAAQWVLESVPDVDDNDPEDQWNGTESSHAWFERTRPEPLLARHAALVTPELAAARADRNELGHLNSWQASEISRLHDLLRAAGIVDMGEASAASVLEAIINDASTAEAGPFTDAREGSWIVITASVAGAPDLGYLTEYTSDLREFSHKPEAVEHGFTLSRMDDFNLGFVRDGRLESLWWMDKQFPDDAAKLAEIGREIGRAE